MRDVVILGSGFAGLEAAVLLSKEKDIALTVVDKSKYFTFAPSIHFLISDKRKLQEITIDLEKFYKKRNVKFVKEGVIRINPEKDTVETRNKTIKYDFLIISSGFETNFFNTSIRENSIGLKTIEEAFEIKKRLSKIKKNIVIAGGGLTGIETAYEIKESSNFKIILVEKNPQLMPQFNKKLGIAVERHILKTGIEVKKGTGIKGIKKKIILDNGDSIKADLVIWTAGIKLPEWIIKSKIPYDGGGIIVNQFLHSTEYDRIYAAGDVASVQNADSKKTAQTAVMMGKRAAKNIIRKINGKPQRGFRTKQELYLISLGKDGLIVYKNFFMINRIFLWMKNLVEKMYLAFK